MASSDIPNRDIDSAFFHLSLNLTTASQTIVLIHGAFSSSDDWDLVTPYLKGYHLLIPDLPGHGRNIHLKPFSLQHAAQRIRGLIQAHAKNGKAHIVGLSLGAHVGLYLAITYPEVVDTVMLSGFSAASGKQSTGPGWLRSWMPYLFYTEQRIENCIPRSLIRWLMDGADLKQASGQCLTPSLCRDIMDTLNANEFLSPWLARTLIIAATKSGLIPSFDSPERTAQLVSLGKTMNPKTMGAQHTDMRHPWCRQDPKLFAETVQAWIEGKAMPSGFQTLLELS